MADMHGKNTMVVDEDADLDLAASRLFTRALDFQVRNIPLELEWLFMKRYMIVVLEKAMALTENIKVGNPEIAETNSRPCH